ncbi:LOW QUALITY PROTEIN: uncharacterized protein LOC121676970 [Arvicola amphibius]|uniref:LOW QUALITY PROTEIN: uncharacterized protein LOC121676970 n=1 Tax=Arvicola amphibius TaxID=1047088 RepID=UPI001C09E278|nr:LOW QUALITY PROTEIN: uncharacterized protein LOC121676970 [Arvicola amphibius]
MKRLLCSLLGLLYTQICWVKGQQVNQSPVFLVLQEGENAELQCNFSNMATQVQWFYQSPGGPLISLIYNPSGTKQRGRLKSTTVTQERRSSLYISSCQTTDSGTYFCATMHSAPHTPAASTQTFSWMAHTKPMRAQLGPSSKLKREGGHTAPPAAMMVLTIVSFGEKERPFSIGTFFLLCEDTELAYCAGSSWDRRDEVGKWLLGKPSTDKSILSLFISQTFCQNLYPG